VLPWEEDVMAVPPSVSVRRRSGVFVVVALAAALALVSVSCSKGRDTNSGSTSSAPTLHTIFVQKFRFNGVPTTLKSGYTQFYFQNKESFPITHEMIPIALPAGKSATDVQAEAKAKGPSSEDEWLHIGGDMGAVDTGAGIIETLYLPPGNYAVACWQTGKANGAAGEGAPHAALGMVAQFTVT
jgi:hypothetical protein